MAVDDRYLTSHEAAELLGVTRATLYAYVSRGLVSSEPADDPRRRAHRYPQRALERLKARRERRLDDGSPWSAPLLDSSISLIQDGRLWYRGVDACELSRTATVEQVASLLWSGTSDGGDELFPRASRRRTRIRGGAFADRLVACLVEERGRHPWSLAEPTEATLRAAGATISALFDAAGAIGSGTLAERLARGWCVDADDLRAALILCADHELNTTAFTARCVASTDAPISNALLAALCALEGRRHGGAADRDVCDLLDAIERVGVAEACTRVVERRGLLFGVGVHPRYPDGDPRARELLRRLDLPPTATAAQAIAFGERIGGSPTIELALAALTRPADLPDDAPFALFALGRSLGWAAHALEAASQDTLIRPRARYTGPPPIAVAR